MTDYESGKKARLEREPLLANPYWGWFRRVAWERGWLDEDRFLAARQDIETAGSQQSLSCHGLDAAVGAPLFYRQHTIRSGCSPVGTTLSHRNNEESRDTALENSSAKVGCALTVLVDAAPQEWRRDSISIWALRMRASTSACRGPNKAPFPNRSGSAALS